MFFFRVIQDHESSHCNIQCTHDANNRVIVQCIERESLIITELCEIATKKLKGVMTVVADNLLGSMPAYRQVLHAFPVVIYCSVGVFNVMLKLSNIIIE